MMTGHFRLLSGHYVAIVYAITKILYAFNVVAQFVILNYCLKSDEYLFFGFQVRKGIFDTKLIIRPENIVTSKSLEKHGYFYSINFTHINVMQFICYLAGLYKIVFSICVCQILFKPYNDK